MQAPCIRIKMLGEFQVTVNGAVVGDSTRSNQIWNLLQYLVAFRHKVITQEELIDAMWEDGTGDPVVPGLTARVLGAEEHRDEDQQGDRRDQLDADVYPRSERNHSTRATTISPTLVAIAVTTVPPASVPSSACEG